jgi:hypothetical protein
MGLCYGRDDDAGATHFRQWRLGGREVVAILRCVRASRWTDLVIRIRVPARSRASRLIQGPAPLPQGQEQDFRNFQQYPKESSVIGD